MAAFSWVDRLCVFAKASSLFLLAYSSRFVNPSISTSYLFYRFCLFFSPYLSIRTLSSFSFTIYSFFRAYSFFSYSD